MRMRRAGAVACVLVARVAAAEHTVWDEHVPFEDEREVAVSAALASQALAGAAASSAGHASVRAEANVSELVGHFLGYRFAIGAMVEARAGVGDAPATATSWLVRAAIEDTPLYDGGPHLGVFPTRVELAQQLDRLPSLRDARSWLRLPYDRESITVDTAISRGRDEEDTWSSMLMPTTISVERARQRTGDRVIERDTAEASLAFFRLCGPWDDDPVCLRIWQLNATFSDGPAEMRALFFMPVTAEGVPLGDVRVDAQVGMIGGTLYHLGANELHTVGYQLAVRRGGYRVEVARRSYATMTGELAIEDRASLSLQRSGQRYAVEAYGHLEATQLWAVPDDTFVEIGRAITGGGDVTVSRSLGRWRIASTLAAGRSWYGAPDGGAPRAGFAAQGSLAVHHERRKRWTRPQPLRIPDPPI